MRAAHTDNKVAEAAMYPTLIAIFIAIIVLLWVSMWMVQIDNYTEQTPKCTHKLNMISVIIGAVQQHARRATSPTGLF